MRFKTGILAAALLTVPLAAGAADLGGNCCSDLEERVAELEATTARKGNRKLSVIISGQIDPVWIYESSNAKGSKSQFGVASNPNSPSALDISGEANAGNGVMAGFRVEFGLDTHTPLTLTSNGDAQPDIRLANAWVQFFSTKTDGGMTGLRLTFGQQFLASAGTAQVSVANTAPASKLMSLGPASIFLLGFDLSTSAEQARRQAIRVDTPVFGGLTLSGSVANGDVGPISFGGNTFNTTDAWDVAAKFAKEIGGFRVAAAVSYRDEQQVMGALFNLVGTRATVTAGSISVMHMTSGLFANLAGASITKDQIFGNYTSVGAQLGWEKNITGWGATTLFGEYTEMSLDNTNAFTGKSATIAKYGLGAVQSIDSVATDLYINWTRYDDSQIVKFAGTGLQGDIVMTGLRVKF